LLLVRHYHTAILEGVCRTWLWFAICEQHLIVFRPVLMILLKKKLRLNTRTASGKVLPPLFWFICFRVERQLLAMNSDGLAAKFLCVFFDHLFASTLLNLCSGPSSRVFILHSQMTHFPRIQSLFCILYFFKIMFERLQVSQVLYSSLFL
jgi:hypothetical protein